MEDEGEIVKLSDETLEFLLLDKGQKADFLNAHFERLYAHFKFLISTETRLLGYVAPTVC